jgi:dTDP-glucose 4,6-dehydratase
MRILITGGAGFIGSNLSKHLLEKGHELIIIDKLSYASNTELVGELEKNRNYHFEKLDICESERLEKIFSRFKPQSVFHLAAESHVDRSISGPEDFIHSNIIGTYKLLEQTRKFLNIETFNKKEKFKFIHVSTDEVYGDLGVDNCLSTEESSYNPSSPYSASKASSDFLVKAWMRTYKFPALITHCSNNYGPYQHNEKFIPSSISKILKNQKLAIYGDGKQIRDWIYVIDHVEALELLLLRGKLFETYNIGGNNQIKNIDLIYRIIALMSPMLNIEKNDLHELIEFVEDRPGHDIYYGLDCTKIKRELGWEPKNTLDITLKETIDWYRKNSKKLS